jgi:chromosome segregation ATPase
MDFKVIDRKFQDAFVRVKKDIEGLQDYSERIEGNVNAIRQDLKAVDDVSMEIKDLKNKSMALENSISENEESLSKLRRELESQNSGFEARLEAVEQVKKTLVTLNSDVVRLNQFLENFALDVAYKQDLLAAQKEGKDSAVLMKQDIKELREGMQASKNAFNTELNSLGNSLGSMQKEIKQAQTSIKIFNEDYVTLSDFNTRAVNENKEINSILKKIKALEKNKASFGRKLANTNKVISSTRAEARNMVRATDFNAKVQAIARKQILAGLRNLKVKSELERKAKRQLLKALRQRKENTLTNVASYLEGKR